MLAHAKDPAEGGSRIAIITNGSPLFTGDAGSGESEIRVHTGILAASCSRADTLPICLATAETYCFLRFSWVKCRNG